MRNPADLPCTLDMMVSEDWPSAYTESTQAAGGWEGRQTASRKGGWTQTWPPAACCSLPAAPGGLPTAYATPCFALRPSPQAKRHAQCLPRRNSSSTHNRWGCKCSLCPRSAAESLHIAAQSSPTLLAPRQVSAAAPLPLGQHGLQLKLDCGSVAADWAAQGGGAHPCALQGAELAAAASTLPSTAHLEASLTAANQPCADFAAAAAALEEALVSSVAQE